MKESLYFLFFGENMKQAVRYFKVLCGHSLQIKDSLIAITYKIFKYFLSGIIIVIFCTHLGLVQTSSVDFICYGEWYKMNLCYWALI